MSIVGGNLIVYLTTDTTQFERGMSKSKSMLDGLKGSAQIAAGVLMRDLARGLTQGAVEALKMGAQIETLRNSFVSLSAASGKYVPSLEELRLATQGMVSDTDLLLRANEALALGIPTENLDDLFDSAIRLGKAMGLDATQGIQALTIGVGRQSRLVLDNLGIIVKAEEAYAEYAKRIGKTTETLTENERRLGFQTIALEKISEKAAVLGDNVSDTEKNMSKWTATIKNATTALGELLQPLGALAPVFQTLGPTIGVMAATILPTLSAATLGWIGVGIAAVAGVTILVGAFQKWRRETDKVILAQDRLEDSQRSVATASQSLLAAEEDLTTVLEAEASAHDVVNKAIDRRVEASERLADAEHELNAAEADLGIAQQDLANYISFLSGEVDEYVAVTEDMTFSSEDVRLTLEGLSSSSDDAKQAFADLSTELGVLQGAYNDTLQAMTELNDEMNSNDKAIKRSRHEINKIKDDIQDRADAVAWEITVLEDKEDQQKDVIQGIKDTLKALKEQQSSKKELSDSDKNALKQTEKRIGIEEQRLKQIDDQIAALKKQGSATQTEEALLRTLNATIRDRRLENTELSFSLDKAKDAAEEHAQAVSEQEQALSDQEQTIADLQDSIDILIEKDNAAEKAQDAVAEKTEAVSEAFDAEAVAVGEVETALSDLTTAHDNVVTSQETLRDSNFELESSIRGVERATDDLAEAEAERERQRIEREIARAEAEAGMDADEGLGYGGEEYPTSYDPFGRASTVGDTYHSASTQTSSIKIDVNVGSAGTMEEGRRYGRELAEEAVRELRKRGVVM